MRNNGVGFYPEMDQKLGHFQEDERHARDG